MPQELQDNLSLLINELVTNSVRHSGRQRRAEILMSVALGDDRVRAEVTDQGDGFAVPVLEEDPTQTDGRGLLLVDRLSDRWGVRSGHPTTVWFELDVGRSA